MISPQSAFEHLSKDELIQHIEALQEELHLSRAFSDIPEVGLNDAVLHWRGRNRFLAEKPVPVQLRPVAAESLYPEKGEHRIIDGDNLSVMTSLLTEFRGGLSKGIDVIYMDPPYNTGEDVFSYNDDYRLSDAETKAIRRRVGRSESLVSLDDPSRHTKWINHMAPRLWAARKLLKSTGIIVVSIDEHELPRLWMLMEEIFSPKNRVATLVWERSRKNDASYVSEGHEYMLVWARNKTELDAKRRRLANTPEWADSKGRWRKRKDGADSILAAYAEARHEYGDDLEKIQASLDLFFKKLPPEHPARSIRYKKADLRGVYNDDGDLSWPGGGGPKYDVIHPITLRPCKVPSRGWAYPEETMDKLKAEGRIAFKKDHTKIPRLKKYLHEMEDEVRTSVIPRTGQRAVEVVDSILGEGMFKNPKDHELLAEIFNLVTWRDKDAIILDPYAGSGTTGHAVLDMNAADGGRRRFILVESGDPKAEPKVPKERYVAEITAERVRRVITGRWADGEEHPQHDTGFTFYEAQDEITKGAIMVSTRETLADIILQVVEDESNRIDCRVEGYTYLIGKTRTGYGIGLVWDADKTDKDDQVLTWEILDKVLDEADAEGVTKPVYIYASANAAPLDDDLYRFHQIPDSILARLGILDGSEEYEE